MKSSSLVFLAAFIALAASWGGFVLAPQIQIGRAPQEKSKDGGYYPVARAGVARQGAEVYRSLGCVYCHSQQVGQDKTACEIVLEEPGTNATAILAALQKVSSNPTLSDLPKVVAEVKDVPSSDPIAKSLRVTGAKVSVRVVPKGTDISRGWGLRRSVAQDFAYDGPVQPGARRNGPDLTNLGEGRKYIPSKPEDAIKWHLLHLYSPRTQVSDSTMPPYPFLFEKRSLSKGHSAEALDLPSGVAPQGFEIVPTDAAKALVTYLLSLRTEVPLDEAPFTPRHQPAPATNAPAMTNKVATLPYSVTELLSISAETK